MITDDTSPSEASLNSTLNSPQSFLPHFFLIVIYYWYVPIYPNLSQIYSGLSALEEVEGHLL